MNLTPPISDDEIREELEQVIHHFNVRTTRKTTEQVDLECNDCNGVYEHQGEELTNEVHETCRHNKTPCCKKGGLKALQNWLNWITIPQSASWYEIIILPTPENTEREFDTFLEEFEKLYKEQIRNSHFYNTRVVLVLHEYEGQEEDIVKHHRETECGLKSNVTHLHAFYVKVHERRGINNVLRQVLQKFQHKYSKKERGTKLKTLSRANAKLQYILQEGERKIAYDKINGAEYQSITNAYMQMLNNRKTSKQRMAEKRPPVRRKLRYNSESSGEDDGSYDGSHERIKRNPRQGNRMDTQVEKSNQPSGSKNGNRRIQQADDGGSGGRGKRRRSAGSESDWEILEEEEVGPKRNKLGQFVRTNTNEDNNARKKDNLTREILGWIMKPEVRSGTPQEFKKYIVRMTMDRKPEQLIEIAQLINRPNFEQNLKNMLAMKQTMMENITWAEELKHMNDLDEKHMELYFPTNEYANKYYSARAIVQALDYQGVQIKTFINVATEIVNKKHAKKNTLFIMGPPNCGKTRLIQSIAEAFTYKTSITNFTRYDNFTLNDTKDMRIATADELIIESTKAPQALLFLEGQRHMTNVKYQSQQVQERIPVLVTGNRPLWYACEEYASAIKKRIQMYRFKPNETLKDTAKLKWHPLAWYELIKTFHINQKIEDQEHYNNVYKEQVEEIIKQLHGVKLDGWTEKEAVDYEDIKAMKDLSLTCKEELQDSEDEYHASGGHYEGDDEEYPEGNQLANPKLRKAYDAENERTPTPEYYTTDDEEYIYADK